MKRLVSLLVLIGAGAASTPACGARTDLHECFVQGARRSCENICGRGWQLCDDGRWTACDAANEIECYNESCESMGTQWCENDTLERICHTQVTVGCRSVCGEGTRTCTDGEWTACDAPRPKPPLLDVTVRDFHESHPDFEFGDRPDKRVFDPGIVEVDLGPDDKPAYAGDPDTPSTTGKANFDQWYRDVPDVNWRGSFEIELAEVPNRPGVYFYRNNSFFPIDNELFGNEGNLHNYHFTVELETRFLYVGGESFSFSGDDDLWVFINRRLALDIGGVHESMTDIVYLDAQADELGIEVGGIYDVHLFFAERHTIESNFEIETTIAEWDFCD